MGDLIFGSIDTQGQTFGDIKAQTSKAGVPRPIVFGRVRPIKGNVIATTEPKIVKRKKKKSNGLLAPSTTTRWEEVYRTYAIRICEGPVTGVRRVWEGDDLVYHRDSSDATQIENNQVFLQKAEFFLGGWDQMPSSVMQAAFGVDNVHAYRGTCYMVVDNEELTRTSGAVPEFTFEVENAEGFILTTKQYPLVIVDGPVTQAGLVSASLEDVVANAAAQSESVAAAAGFVSGLLELPTVHAIAELESVAAQAGFVSGLLENPTVHYTAGDESAAVAAGLVAGLLEDAVISYTAPGEYVDVSAGIASGSLEIP